MPGAMPGWTLPKRVFQPFVLTPSGIRWKHFGKAEARTAAAGICEGLTGARAFMILSSLAHHKADLGQGWLP